MGRSLLALAAALASACATGPGAPPALALAAPASTRAAPPSLAAPAPAPPIDPFRDPRCQEGPDRDADHVPDAVDRCPAQPERYNGVDDDDGCPDDTRIVGHLRPLRFAAGSTEFADPPREEALLAGVAWQLGNFPRARVEIVGHSDDRELPDPDARLALSLARAEAVRARLLRGPQLLDPQRLMTRGVGDREPVDSNATTTGRAWNRHVELRLPDDLAPACP